jgi:hypothetical protein
MCKACGAGRWSERESDVCQVKGTQWGEGSAGRGRSAVGERPQWCEGVTQWCEGVAQCGAVRRVRCQRAVSAYRAVQACSERLPCGASAQ